MTNRVIDRQAFDRTIQAIAVMAAVVFGQGCSEDARNPGDEFARPSASEISDEKSPASADNADLTLQIQSFCGACHAVPLPASFPKQAWFNEVERGFRFYYESGRQDLMPPRQASVVEWYVHQAPEQLAAAQQTESPASSLNFSMRPFRVAIESTEAAAVSVVRLSDSRSNPSQFCVSDMRRGVVVVCDVNNAASSQIHRFGSNPAGSCDVDLDQDGIVDLVVADLGTFAPEDHNRGQVLFRSSRDHSNNSSPRVILSSVGRVADVQAADLDSDGDQDLVVAEFGWHKTGGIHAVFNDAGEMGERTFRIQRLDSRPGTIQVPVMDLNGDGRLDFVALISQEHEVIEAFMNREAGFEKIRIFAAPDPSFGSSGIELTDMDNDGDVDVLYTAGDTFDSYLIKPYHGIWLLRNDGQLKFTAQHIAAMPGVHRAVGADLDGDGDTDIVASALLPPQSVQGQSRSDLQALIWLEQTEDRTFARHIIQQGLPIYASVAVSDIDGDRDLDIVAGCFHSEPMDQAPLLHVFENLRLGR